MIQGVLIMTVTLAIVLLLKKAFIRLAELSEAKKSHFRRFYLIFLGVFFIIHGIVMGISNNAWGWIELFNIGFGSFAVILSLAFPQKL